MFYGENKLKMECNLIENFRKRKKTRTMIKYFLIFIYIYIG